jgi:uncharacterized repeat protein (TIGR03806 family)
MLHGRLLLASLSFAALCGCGDTVTPPPGDGGATDLGAPADAPVDAGPAAATGLDRRPTNAACVAFARPTAAATVRLTRVFASQTTAQHVALVQRPGDNARWYEVVQGGTLRRFDVAGGAASSVLSLAGRITAGGEAGFLGWAFHPRFAQNGFAYASYTAPRRAGMTEAHVSRVSRFVSRDGGDTFDPATETVLLEISQPYSNHNGGQIAFGPDGYLYFGMGDGGSANDPMRHGQNVNSLLGKMLRIDVDTPSAERPYGIPADNPFAGGGGAPEVWAWGLRNPWRWSFDRVTGELWAGDVGQNALEEIDIVRRGGNYGWYGMEGTRCTPASPCPQPGRILPVAEYGRSLGTSITGGYVYRGRAVPSLVGRYLFGDYVSGRLWTLRPGNGPTQELVQLANTTRNIASFAEDQDGEVYIVYYNGVVDRIEAGETMGTDTVPRALVDTGCVDRTDPLRPAEGLIPYAPVAPFWSDGADKERFMALPEGGQITVGPDGDFEFPNGTVLVKNFTYNGRRFETRLFVRHPDGEWAGYSYRWADDQRSATLLQADEVRDLGGGLRWLYPSRNQCMECHTAAAGRSLGLELAQLNSEITYPATGRRANQLATLQHIGLFAAPLPAQLPAPLAAYDGPAPLEARARAYLHSNCSNCHRPGAPGRGGLDLRASASASALGLCDAVPSTGDLGVAGARLVAPGDPSRSIVSIRSRRTDGDRMPPISSRVVDPVGAALLDAWITSLTRCP